MANFARSLKSPSYLSPRLRPSMPGRTLSSSSDVSVTSNNSTQSDDFGELLSSGRNTPTLPPGRGFSGTEGNGEAEDASSRRLHIRGGEEYDATPANVAHPRHSRPIAIELPKVKRFSTAAGAVRTPPEPLSARGDLPGGYFPLHEDPSARIHRPHPFHHDRRMGHRQSSGLAVDSGPMFVEHTTSHPTGDMAHSHTPVASYIPAGFHENPLPMGKYYPSNYEQRNSSQTTLRPSVSGSLSATVKSDSQVPLRTSDPRTQSATAESEVRRRLQQYKRDMMTQASMAASEIMSSSATSNSSGDSNSLNRMVIPEMRFTAPGSRKPRRPELLPLGSPGPVTPMELDSDSGGDYLARGREDERPAAGLMPPPVGLIPRTP
ncbi:Fc.00g035600.m01.CDS01 [Cosmosporella sp. VM-42]